MKTTRQIILFCFAGFVSTAQVMAVPVIEWNTVSMASADDYYN